jgi:hypothetical protein
MGDQVNAIATDGPMKGLVIPFAGEGSATRVVGLPNGELAFVRHSGEHRGTPLGQYVCEDGKAVWMPISVAGDS